MFLKVSASWGCSFARKLVNYGRTRIWVADANQQSYNPDRETTNLSYACNGCKSVTAPGTGGLKTEAAMDANFREKQPKFDGGVLSFEFLPVLIPAHPPFSTEIEILPNRFSNNGTIRQHSLRRPLVENTVFSACFSFFSNKIWF
ncbi:hypothetical protein Zmor_000229 [Zophobas morio]|uniref:Uncharacterized protein n=1 Tax=Zophobas morio TaxID=2755281 RepID=A0AA38J5N2_9CUCU|nr:hypothetical protein Zmor_000229 [Zophobas morio]